MSNGTSHEDQYQAWLHKQELKGRPVHREGELIPQEKREMTMNFDASNASAEVLKRLGFNMESDNASD